MQIRAYLATRLAGVCSTLGVLVIASLVTSGTAQAHTVGRGGVYGGGGNITLQAPGGGAGNLSGSVPPPTK